jgi:hypothetical protein
MRIRMRIFKFLMRIRDPGWRQLGSGIRDGKKVGYVVKHSGSVTLVTVTAGSEYIFLRYGSGF